MKKIFLIALFGILCGSIAQAEEMVVKLKSGNSLVIQYTGNIQGVTLNGETDAIEGFNLPAAAQNTAKNQQIEPRKQAVQASPENAAAKAKNEDKSWFQRVKWAEPKTED